MFVWAPFRLGKYMTRNRFEEILSKIRYTDKPTPTNLDKFFQMRQMEDSFNENMSEVFDPSWVSVLDESMQVWINRFTCPGWMCVGRKPHPFGNERHTLACGKSTIMYRVELVEGCDRPLSLKKIIR